MNWRKRYLRMAVEGPSGLGERVVFSLLAPLGWLYGTILAFRLQAYRIGLKPIYRAEVPVISVGNLAAGGTGKTPTVDWFIKAGQALGKRVAVVSRGYGGSWREGVGVVCAGQGVLMQPSVSGDEPCLLARRNPEALVLVARRRAEGVRKAVQEHGADLVILDDGFQHLAVHRDLDLVLLDAKRPLGNGQVLPAGILREFPRALRRADLLMLTRSSGGEAFEGGCGTEVLHARHLPGRTFYDLAGAAVESASLAGKRGIAFAGIADPGQFFEGMKALGLHLADTVALGDHVEYSPDVLARVLRRSREADYLVTTEKDGVKLGKTQLSLPCYQVPLGLEIFERERLERALGALFSKE